MGTQKPSEADKLFENLILLLKNQQQQLQTLIQERKFLEDRIKLQHERCLSDVRLYQDHITQMENALKEKDLACLIQASKADLLLGLKHRETALHKFKLEQTGDDLADFKLCYDHLLSQVQELNSKGTDSQMEGGKGVKSSGYKRLGSEVKRLQSEYEKIASEKESEISALLKEKSFVWNQYNVLERDLNDKLKSKLTEFDLVNAEIEKVLGNVKMLQTSNREKDKMIEKLKAKLCEVEIVRDKSKAETSRLSKELDSLKNSRTAQFTPSLKPCSTGSKVPNQVIKSNGKNGSNVTVKNELFSGKAAADSEKGSKGVKRKELAVINISDSATPKLFSVAFKPPKLKSLSTPVA